MQHGVHLIAALNAAYDLREHAAHLRTERGRTLIAEALGGTRFVIACGAYLIGLAVVEAAHRHVRRDGRGTKCAVSIVDPSAQIQASL